MKLFLLSKIWSLNDYFFIIKAIKNVIIIMFIHCNFYKLNNIKTVQLTLQINLQEQTFPGIN